MAFTLVLTGCRRDAAPVRTDAGTVHPVSSALGWRVDAPTELIREGAVRTTPPGHEEAVMALLPGAARRAARGCRGDAASSPLPPSASFRFEARADAGYAPGGDPPGDAFRRCIVDALTSDLRALDSTAQVIDVQLVFRQ